jgi:hypothetical protein
MYFALNKPSAALPAIIAQEIDDLWRRKEHAAAGAPFHVFALVDANFDEQFFKGASRINLLRRSLYDNTSLMAMGAAAPFLVEAPVAAVRRQAWLEALFAACEGKPMLSIIACTADIDTLQRHLRPYLIAITEDTVQWPVRWGDTRVLPALLAALSDELRNHLLRPLLGWWTAARDGNLLSWQGRGDPNIQPAQFDKLPLDESTFGVLVDLAEPDGVLANIADTQPDLLRKFSPAECHCRVARHLSIATRHRIEAASARQHFSVLALLLTDDFALEPEMANLLQNTQQGAEYATEIAKLTPAFWEATYA